MSKISRGRKLNKFCSRCGIEKTDENTYKRKNGYMLHVCKACSSEISRENRMKRMSEEDRNKLKARYKILTNSIDIINSEAKKLD